MSCRELCHVSQQKIVWHSTIGETLTLFLSLSHNCCMKIFDLAYNLVMYRSAIDKYRVILLNYGF